MVFGSNFGEHLNPITAIIKLKCGNRYLVNKNRCNSLLNTLPSSGAENIILYIIGINVEERIITLSNSISFNSKTFHHSIVKNV